MLEVRELENEIKLEVLDVFMNRLGGINLKEVSSKCTHANVHAWCDHGLAIEAVHPHEILMWSF